MTFQTVMPSVIIFTVLAAVSDGLSAAVLDFVLTVFLASLLAIDLAVVLTSVLAVVYWVFIACSVIRIIAVSLHYICLFSVIS